MANKINLCIISGEDSAIVPTVEEILRNTGQTINIHLVKFEECLKTDKHQLCVILTGSGEVEKTLEYVNQPVSFARKIIPVLFTEGTLDNMIALLSHPDIDQVVRREYNWENNLRVVLNVLFTGEIFGMEKYIGKDDQVSYLRFNDYKGRQDVLEKVRNIAQDMGLRRIRREHAVEAAEELVMNALYNAPREEDGEMIFGNIDPHKRVQMDSPKPVSLRYSVTQEGLYMAVRDRFGALDKNTVLSYIKKCLYSKEQIDRKTIGAGLGIFLTVRRVQSYIVNVAPNVATEIIISLRQAKEIGVPAVMAFFRYSRE